MNDLSSLEHALQQTLPMARLEAQQLPGCEPIQLALINADFPTGPLPGDVMHNVIANPAYWAFCWGSGLGLAQTLLAHPERVAGKRVADIGSGSGVAGIGAAIAGASQVIACDIDPHACLATRTNARLNRVDIEVVTDLGQLGEVDIVLMADVLYDRSNFTLLAQVCERFDHILVADSRVKDLQRGDFSAVGQVDALTFPNLGEFDEYRVVSLFERTVN